jgi:hypothetical protein
MYESGELAEHLGVEEAAIGGAEEPAPAGAPPMQIENRMD